MLSLTLHNLWSRKRRLAGAGIAVVLGVAFLFATLTLADTLRSGFDQLYTDANAGIDVVVRDATVIGNDEMRRRGTVDGSLAGALEGLPGVAAVVPTFDGVAQLVASDGNLIGGDGPPTVGRNWIGDGQVDPWRLATGRAPLPREDGLVEIVIDRAAATTGALGVGDVTTVLTPAPLDAVVVGIATFGELDSLGPTTFTAFAADVARELFVTGTVGGSEVSSLLVAASPGTDPATLRADIAALLPSGAEALTGAELTAEQLAEIESDFLAFIEVFLLAFAVVALFVAAISIANTFSILVAQRTRESALLRAIGATRAQVLTSTASESLLVGAMASALGLGVGYGLGLALRALLASFGVDLPGSGLVISATSVIVALSTGILVTLAASVLPAIRAARVAPLAALREVALDRVGRIRLRTALGLAGCAIGTVLVIVATREAEGAVGRAAIGSVVLVVAVLVLTPALTRPAMSALAAPLHTLRGPTGRIAGRNATRTPKRTAASASALVVGTAVASLFTTVGSSITASVGAAVDRSFGGDLVIEQQTFSGAALDPRLAAALEALPEVTTAVGASLVPALIEGSNVVAMATDPTRLDAVFDFGVVEGDMATLAAGGLAVSEREALRRGWAFGAEVPIAFTDGGEAPFTVTAIYRERDLFGDVLLHRDDWAPQGSGDVVVLVDLAPGVDVSDGAAAVDAVGNRFLAPDSQTRDQYVDSIAGEIRVLLGLVYGLLGVAVLIALIGIANTLSLSIHERTRELGLLRAIGQTRSQLRATVRWEALLTATFGTLVGVVLGVGLAWGLVRAVAAQEQFGTFDLPLGTLVVIVVVAALAGAVAAIRPARRAARLDVLTAVAAE